MATEKEIEQRAESWMKKYDVPFHAGRYAKSAYIAGSTDATPTNPAQAESATEFFHDLLSRVDELGVPEALQRAVRYVGRIEGREDQASDMNDPFIVKHLARIKEKLLECYIEDNLKHLQHPPLDASVKYFLETGTVNGNFLLAIKDLVYRLPKMIQDELEKAVIDMNKKEEEK